MESARARMNRSVRRSFARIARRLGLWRTRRIFQGEKLRGIFEAHGITAVLDIGANEGQFRDFLRIEVGFDGVIHSVEPIASLAAKMERRAATDPNWYVHRLALGSESGDRDLNVMAMPEFSSFLAPHAALSAQFQDQNKVVQTERIRVERLDEFVLRLQPIDLPTAFIKIDTQGFDLEVIKGGDSILRLIPALQTELSIRPIYEGAPSWVEVIQHLSNLGFGLSDMFAVTEDELMRVFEFDCVMVRSILG